MKHILLAAVSASLIGCVFGHASATKELRPTWSLEEDVSSAFAVASDQYEEGLIAFPMKRIFENEAYRQLSGVLATRFASCDRLIVMQVVAETGEEAESGWLCELSGERKVQVGKFGVVDDDSFEIRVEADIETGVFDHLERELLPLSAIDASRYTTLDGVAVAVTLIRRRSVVERRYFYDPYNVDYDELDHEFASAHDGFDRFYIGMIKVLEGICKRDCLD